VILYEPGDKVVFDVLRDAESVSIEVTLGKYETGVFRR
jgi:S1-C subfamily serine protease